LQEPLLRLEFLVVPTFHVENFGCRATDADASAIRADLAAAGLGATRDAQTADIVVLNTCTVTAAADAQAREAIRKLHRANPAARIIVTGCYAQRASEEVAALEGVTCVVGNSQQRQIPGLIGRQTRANGFVPLEALAQQADTMSIERAPAKILTGDIFEQTTVELTGRENGLPAADAAERTRPILKVQDGCNNRCAYCVIPFVRGRSRSLPPDKVVREAQRLASAGAREIVLSGINLGSYGRDLYPRVSLNATVRRILNETSVEHLRFSSIEPQDVTEDFVALVADSDRLAPHFHVPLQSGSDRMLRAMHRWYRTALYAERMLLIRKLLPGAAIGADVIVGFPGETTEDFAETLRFIQELPLTYLHVFSFSARPGTKAESLGEQVSASAIAERARELRGLSDEKNVAFRRSQAGRVVRALTLKRRGSKPASNQERNWTSALARNYLKVRIAGEVPPNQWLPVVLSAAESEECVPADLRVPRDSALKNDLRQRQIAAVGD
jgi:threonylcarbamoyladenosine tRNA methylthiotransferase MtaB